MIPYPESKPSKEEVILLRRKVEAKKQYLELVKNNGLVFYKPHEKQDKFHRAGNYTYRMLRAGNRFGKSQMGCAEDCAWLMRERPWYDLSDPARYEGIPQRPIKMLVIAENWDKVDSIFTSEEGKMWQLLPSFAIKQKIKGHNGVVCGVRMHNGSYIRFATVQSYKKDPLSMESDDWDAIHIDEPCPEGMYKAAHRGLVDRNGKCWFTLTPLSEMWINDKFFPHKSLGKTLDMNHWALQGGMRDNPHLTEEAIKKFENELTLEERKCRLNGIPLALSGLVYKEFNYDKHVLTEIPKGWENFHTPPQDYTVSYSIDPHPQTPHAVLFIATDPYGHHFLFNEIFDQVIVSVLSERIKSIIGGRMTHKRNCDPSAWINDPISGGCFAEELRKNGVWVEKASKDRAFATQQVRKNLLTPNKLFINPHLNRFLFEVNRYAYDKENKPSDKDDHMMEAWGRLFIDEPRFIKPQESSDGYVPRRPILYNRSRVIASTR